MTKIDLNKLKILDQLAEDACKAAFKQRKEIDDAVNWGDLHSVEARWTVNHEGRAWYTVCVEEASPNADKLRVFVSNYLELKGYPGVVVETEW